MTEATPDPDRYRVSATRRIPAPAERIFAVIASPQGHVDIDGSGSVIATSAASVTAVGDVFVMEMDRRPIGDQPDMAEYTVSNLVSIYEQDRVLAWMPGVQGRSPFGHSYGYVLEPVDDTTTDVTSYCDWSTVREKWRDAPNWPVIPASTLARSLERLEEVVTRG